MRGRMAGMRIAEAVKLLASPFSVQEAFLGEIPENASAPDFDARNDVLRMAVLLLDSLCVQDGDGGSEGVESWRARTQIAPESTLPTLWLATGLRMLVKLREPFLYTRHGLRSAHEWQLIRHLAGEVCDEMSWSRDLKYTDFHTLWCELSDGVLDEGIDYYLPRK
jgi:hypothetical protein